MPDRVANIARRLIDHKLDPVPQYLLLKHVLQPADDQVIDRVFQQALDTSVQISNLLHKQKPDGSFGPFDLKTGNDRPNGGTNELALARAIALGLPVSHPALVHLREYLEFELGALSKRRSHACDPWPGASVLVLSSMLIELGSHHPDIVNLQDHWLAVINRSFSDDPSEGYHGLSRTVDLLGDDKHLWPPEWQQLGFSKYLLILMKDRLTYKLEKNMIGYLFEHARGIYPISVRSMRYQPISFDSREALRYIQSIELLNRFPSSSPYLEKAGEWIWEQLGRDGYWDLGHEAKEDSMLPLSDSWRSVVTRKKDCTVRMLLVLSKIQTSCDLNQSICHTL